ncbi:MAG: cell division protein FtsQ/DivIB [Melioribacteraceae bacterium]|nr:cell division protein FtsQ/DivIB [Melioribacteraceae bacterium]
MERNIKITSAVMLSALLSVIVYLSISIEDKTDQYASLIELNGNIHLPKDEYVKFADLREEQMIDISVIRDRLLKHPYIDNVDVVINGAKLEIEVTEKRFDALLLYNGSQFLIDENSLVIPVLRFTQNLDYPVISNPDLKIELKTMQKLENGNDVTNALKMQYALKLVNPVLYEKLSETNLRNGKDILLQFSDMDFPLIIGRGGEISKILTFSAFWEQLNSNKVNEVIYYIDMRYSEHIFLGLKSSIAVDGDDLI